MGRDKKIQQAIDLLREKYEELNKIKVFESHVKVMKDQQLKILNGVADILEATF